MQVRLQMRCLKLSVGVLPVHSEQGPSSKGGFYVVHGAYHVQLALQKQGGNS